MWGSLVWERVDGGEGMKGKGVWAGRGEGKDWDGEAGGALWRDVVDGWVRGGGVDQGCVWAGVMWRSGMEVA